LDNNNLIYSRAREGFINSIQEESERSRKLRPLLLHSLRVGICSDFFLQAKHLAAGMALLFLFNQRTAHLYGTWFALLTIYARL